MVRLAHVTEKAARSASARLSEEELRRRAAPGRRASFPMQPRVWCPGAHSGTHADGRVTSVWTPHPGANRVAGGDSGMGNAVFRPRRKWHVTFSQNSLSKTGFKDPSDRLLRGRSPEMLGEVSR